MTPSERLMYRSHFCSVCHAMTEFGGRVSSLLTNYDITFWLLLNTSLESGAPTEIENRPCTALPFRKVAVRPLRPEVARTMASLNLLLVSSKVEDDAADGESVKAGVARFFLGKKFQSARDYLEQMEFPLDNILGLAGAQAQVEASTNPTLHQLCGPTERTLGEIFASIASLQKKPELKSVLREFGALLGGYLYLWDAWTDRESDIARGRFNAIEATNGSREVRAELYRRLDQMKALLNRMALGPEGSLCHSLLASLGQRLAEQFPRPRASTTPSPRRRLARAGMVHAQSDCCEVDCCECGSCCDCNVCDCNPCDSGDHCCEFNLCDVGSCCCCFCDAGSSHRSKSCCCDDCDFVCLESFCCGESRTAQTHNFHYTPSSSPPQRSMVQRFKSMTRSLSPTELTGAARLCPTCSKSMMTLKVGSTEIDECRNCGGIWLDDQEIETLARTARLPHNLLNRYPVGEHSMQNLPGERPCPACDNSRLVSVPYLGVPVEMCRECHGFWLEHGVLKRVLKAKRSPRRLMKSHKQQWRCPYCEQIAQGGADVCNSCGAPRPKSGFTGKLA